MWPIKDKEKRLIMWSNLIPAVRMRRYGSLIKINPSDSDKSISYWCKFFLFLNIERNNNFELIYKEIKITFVLKVPITWNAFTISHIALCNSYIMQAFHFTLYMQWLDTICNRRYIVSQYLRHFDPPGPGR